MFRCVLDCLENEEVESLLDRARETAEPAVDLFDRDRRPSHVGANSPDEPAFAQDGRVQPMRKLAKLTDGDSVFTTGGAAAGGSGFGPLA